MAILMLCFPIATEVWHVYILQIVMGVLGAVQRNTEKTSLARKVAQEKAGYEIGKYHVWTSIGGAVAVIATGYLVDFFTIGTIFYIASILYVVSGIVLGSKNITIPIFTLIPFICYTKREYKRKGTVPLMKFVVLAILTLFLIPWTRSSSKLRAVDKREIRRL